jgi:outer membrane receptor for monomeric catechols
MPGITGVTNHRFAPQLNFFHPSGISARVQANYVDQHRDYNEFAPPYSSDNDQFWQVDAALNYRLPKRYGIISLGVKNLFDEEFSYIDTDPANPKFQSEQKVMLSVTLQL